MKKINLFAIVLSVLMMAVACKPIVEPPIDDTSKTGSGTETDPYTVAGAIKKNSGDAWVKGYIVGFMSVGDVNVPTFSAETDSVNTNILLADTTEGVTVYIPVQLPIGDVRTGLNLVDNKDNLGKEVLLYGQITQYFGTTGLKGVSYAKLGDKEFGFNPNKPVETEGQGTKESPYTFADLEKVMNRGTEVAYVKAFIVGQVNGMSLNEESAEFDAPFTPSKKDDGTPNTYNTNILIAATATASTVAEVAPVQLPSGAVRLGLNLVENPDMDGKEVILYGSIEKYFGATGMKDITVAYVGDEVFGTEPVNPEGAVFFESFEKSMGAFKPVDIVKPDGLANIWTHDTKYKCLKATAYSEGKKDGEGWIVSPAIDLSKATAAKLTFENAGNYFVDPAKELTVWVSTTSDGTSFNEGWTQLTVDKYSEGTFAFTTSTIDIASYCGNANVRIAFKYISTPDMCGTWEIRNFMVK